MRNRIGTRLPTRNVRPTTSCSQSDRPPSLNGWRVTTRSASTWPLESLVVPPAPWSYFVSGASELVADGGLVDVELFGDVLERQAGRVQVGRLLNQLVSQLADVRSASNASSLEMVERRLPVDSEFLGDLHDRASTLVAKYELLYNVSRKTALLLQLSCRLWWTRENGRNRLFPKVQHLW